MPSAVALEEAFHQGKVQDPELQGYPVHWDLIAERRWRWNMF
jgi:hypothetical protein